MALRHQSHPYIPQSHLPRQLDSGGVPSGSFRGWDRTSVRGTKASTATLGIVVVGRKGVV